MQTPPSTSPRPTYTTPTRRINIGRTDESNDIVKVDDRGIQADAAPKADDRFPTYLAIATALMLVTAGAWATVQKVTAIQADVVQLKETVHELSLIMREQGRQQAEIVQALADKPSVEQITNRLAHPMTQVLQRLERIERGAGGPVKPPMSTMKTTSTAPQASQTAGGAATPTRRLVALTFVFEPKQTKAERATLLWMGPPSKNGTFSREVKYNEVPKGMRGKVTTTPGDCWRVRDPATTDILIDKHCATNVDEEVLVQ